MSKEIKCVMCGAPAKYLAQSTKEPLCPRCATEDYTLEKQKLIRNGIK